VLWQLRRPDDSTRRLGGLHADHVLLELARRDGWELDALRDVNPNVGIGLGVIDIKSNVIESSDEVASRIEAALKSLGDGRVTYVNPDCGFWMLPRSVADGKMRALVKGRDRFLGAA
jgi:5-methyltetrahydropteroyltriglutamate--homocysteine methyltransferase